MRDETQGLPRGWGEIIPEKESQWGPSLVGEAPAGTPVSLPTDAPEAFHLNGQGSSFPLKKVFIILLVVILVGAFGFLGYKFLYPQVMKMQKQGQKVTLTYWGLWETPEAFNEILADWDKTHPNIKINYTNQSPKEYRERLQSALARGDGPDLFRMHATWLPMLKNDLEPVPAQVLSPSTLDSSYYPVVKSSLVLGDKIMGIPLMMDTLALFYNEDIFKLAGKTPPTTWEELRQTACDLTVTDPDNGSIQTAGVALGSTTNVDHWSDILGLTLLQNNADLGKPTDKVAQDAVTWFNLFQTNAACQDKHVWDATLPNSTMAFATGKAAMFFGYSWDVFEIKAINPQLNFKIVATPRLADENLAWASFWAEGVAKNSKNKDAAWEFMKYLSSKETMEKYYQAQSKVRLFGEIYPRSDMAASLTTNELIAPFVEQAARAKTWYLCSRTFDNGINDRIIKYYEDALNSASLGKALPEALQTTATGVGQLLTQYGAR